MCVHTRLLSCITQLVPVNCDFITSLCFSLDFWQLQKCMECFTYHCTKDINEKQVWCTVYVLPAPSRTRPRQNIIQKKAARDPTAWLYRASRFSPASVCSSERTYELHANDVRTLKPEHKQGPLILSDPDSPERSTKTNLYCSLSIEAHSEVDASRFPVSLHQIQNKLRQ